MRTIFKYPVYGGPGSTVVTHIPKGARLLSARLQNGEPMFWFEVDTSNQLEEWLLGVFFTGHPLPNEMCRDDVMFAGTDIDSIGLVYHMYAKPPA